MTTAKADRKPSPARLTGLPPIASFDARVLVLGSMPGTRSLQMQQYYAHPQNRFWPIMERLFGIRADLPYPDRVERLRGLGIAVWDVLQHCEREGSLDTRIRLESEIANDFGVFFAAHRSLAAIFFNGRKAEASFRRHVTGSGIAIPESMLTLPSTSPANASQPFEHRLRQWRQLAAALGQ